jgi:protein gp37
MSDLFHESLSFGQIFRVFAVMQQAPQHVFQVLTKRPARMKEFLEWLFIWGTPTALALGMHEYYEWPYPNVWLGVSAENQETADERIPLLLKTPAATRWLSAEPLLGSIDLHQYTFQFNLCQVPRNGGTVLALRQMLHQAGKQLAQQQGSDLLDWVVVGFESGLRARPGNPEHARLLRDQCVAAGIPFFFKQWGEHSPDGRRVGKKAAGRLLDGREWNEYPGTAEGRA